MNLISLALVSGCLLLLQIRNFPLLEKRWLWAGVLLAVIAAVHLELTGIPWGVVYGVGLWAGKNSHICPIGYQRVLFLDSTA